PRCICPSIFTTDSRLEIQLRSELDEPSGEDARGPLPLRTVGVVLKHDWTCVQRIIEVQIHLQPSSARESKDSREAEVQLVQPVAVHRAGLYQLNRHGSDVARGVASE